MTPPLAPGNARLRRVRALARDRARRREESAFVIEGPTLVAEALAAGVALEAVFVEEAAASAELVDALMVAGVPVVPVAPGALRQAVDVVTPQPIVAVAATPVATLESAVDADLVIVLVGVADPGNAGTLVRAAEAAGAAAVICCDGTVDPWAPKVVRASAGALFHVAVVADAESGKVLDALALTGLTTVGTVAEGGWPYDEVDLTVPVAILLGSEAHGLPAALVERTDVAVTIPMAGRSESLNVAMAGSVLCFEVLRQRRTAAAATNLPPEPPFGSVRGS